MLTEAAEITCSFCGGDRVAVENPSARHPRDLDFGPFATFTCNHCGAFLTCPPPSTDELTRFYRTSGSGIAPELRASRSGDPQSAWYEKCAMEILKSSVLRMNGAMWIEFGPGSGEVASILSNQRPGAKGVCLEFHACPDSLVRSPNIHWIQHDLNTPFPAGLTEKFDVAFAISVIEHVVSPERFLRSILQTMKPGGTALIVGPDYGSLLSQIMGRKWPYYLPGEHLFMPTMTGLHSLVKRLSPGEGIKDYSLSPITIPYSFRYIARFYRVPLASMLPPGWAIPVPAGAFILKLRK